MSAKIPIAFLIFSSLIYLSDGLACYHCKGGGSSNCHSLHDITSLHVEECNRTQVCLKYQDDDFTERACKPPKLSTGEDFCHYASQFNECWTCTTNLCNSSNGIRQHLPTLFITIFLTFLISKLHLPSA